MLVQERVADKGHGLSNEFVVSTNKLFDKALQVADLPNMILLCPRRVNNCGRQNGTSFDHLIENGMLMKCGHYIVRAAGLRLLAPTIHDGMEEEVETVTTTSGDMLRYCEYPNAIFEEEDEFSKIAITLFETGP